MTAETLRDHDDGGGGEGEKQQQQQQQQQQQPGPKTAKSLLAHRPVGEERQNQNQNEGGGGGGGGGQGGQEEKGRQASEAEANPASASAVVVRAKEVSGWEQVMPLHRRTGSSSSGSGGARSGGSRKRSWSSSSSSSSSSTPTPPSCGRSSGENHEHAVSPSGRRQLPVAATTRDGVAGRICGEREENKDKRREERDGHQSPRNDENVDDTKGWVPEVGLDTAHIISGVRRRSLKPQVFTYEQMPRNYTRGPAKEELREGTAANGSAAESDKDGADAASERSGRGGNGSGDGGPSTAAQSMPKKKGKKEKRHNPDRQSGRKTSDTPRGHPNERDSDARAKAAPVANGKSKPQGERSSSAERDAAPKLALSTSVLIARSRGSSADESSDRDTRDGAAPLASSGSGRSEMKDASRGQTGLATRKSSRRATSSRDQKGAGRRGRESTPVTYVKHDRTTLLDDEDTDDESSQSGVARPCGKAGAAGGGGSSAPSFSRRSKRPRPTLQGGSARAVVWGEPCPACRRGEESSPSMKMKGSTAESQASSAGGGSCDPCCGGTRETGAGEGLVRPGQYVYLRAPSAEDLQRSLTSEGEFAAPKAGGLYGSALAGDRIRVWRESGGGGGSGVSGGGGSYYEADVVQFNATSGKHRLRFVVDGAVEDMKLIKPPDDDSGGGGGGNDQHQAARGGSRGVGKERVGGGGGRGVRWLQRRTRRRARDAIRRNASGLCEGPSGEARGLVGDEHDPFFQRQENWRWALSRWRWDLGQRDGYGYSKGGGEARRDAVTTAKTEPDGDGGSRDAKPAGVPLAGDGMFPPIGRILAVERRYVDTGERVVDGDGGEAERGREERATEVMLKVARLWYPQDTRRGMDPFVHGKAEVFEACRMVRPNKGEGDGDACACAPGPSRGARETPAAEARNGARTTTAAHSEKQDPPRRGRSCDRSAASDGRLNSEQPVSASLKVDPLTLWVRACEAHRLASVHPCIDGRLNPCAGKVVNDPYQPQAEFFISHRYCLEADAYFPLESPSSRSTSTGGCAVGAVGVEVGALGSPGGAREGGLHRLPSPRSTKARLLSRRVSDSMLDLPPKWHPLKKRMSLDQGSLSPAGSGRDSPVIGWESAISRSSRTDSGASASGRSTPVDPVAGSPRESSQDGRDPRRIYLCHRCRHALPSCRLQRCMGRGCGNHFCAPCASERSGGLSSGVVKGRPKGTRWPAHTPLPPPPREAFAGPADVGGEKSGCEEPEPWTGPCCQGRCGCRECVTGADQGVLSSWRSRNGLASAVTTAGLLRPVQLLRKEAGAGTKVAAAAAAAAPKKMVGWSGWQSRSHRVKDGNGDVPESVGGRPSGNVVREGGRGRETLACVQAGAHHAGDEAEAECGVAAGDTGVEWCRSCGGPGPAGSLSRCYYCRGGVHASGCQRFEATLTRRRLEEFGLGPAGQFATPPTGDGAVGHGVAVCVRGRWRAGLVLCWSPSLSAHYIRFVDGWDAGEQGGGAASGLHAVPWEGEWVALPSRTTSLAAARSSGEGGESTKRFAAAVGATSARWPLVEIALRLFPPPPRPPGRVGGDVPSAADADIPAPGSCSATRGVSRPPGVTKPPPESRSATKVLKALLKHNFLASQAAVVAPDRKSAADSNQYRPPAIALPSGIAPGSPCAGGVGDDGDGDCREALNGIGPEHIQAMGEERRPWICRACLEAKLHRLQRRVRAQFHAEHNWVEEAPAGGEDAGSMTVASSGGSQKLHFAADEAPTTPLRDSLATTGIGNGTTASARSPPRPQQVAGVVENGGGGGGEDCAPFVPPAVSANDLLKSKKRPREDGEMVGGPVHQSHAVRGGGADESTGHRESEGGTSTAPPAAVAATEASASRTSETDGQRPACRTRRDRRLRWLPAGNPASARPFSFEAGFVSDIAELHARGGPTASGANIGSSTSGSRGRTKRPRPPPVARAFAHLLGTLETQAALAFALPPDVTGLDMDMAAFFSGVANEEGDAAAAAAGTGGGGPLEDEIRSSRSVVLVDGTAAAAAAAGGGKPGAPISAASTAMPGGAKSAPLQQNGDVDGAGASGGAAGCAGVGVVRGGEYGAGAAAAAASLPHIPAGFSSAKEVDLESSARIRPLDSTSKLRRRSSSLGGMRSASRPLRMCSSESPVSLAEDGSLLPSAGGSGSRSAGSGRGGARGSGPPTLKDVSRKDRMQRMDQRRMRRQGQTLMDAGLLNLDVLQSRRKKLRFGRSSVHAWGVFADEPIAAGDLVIEYRGEIIGNAVADKREKQYENMQIGSDYMFRLDEDTVVDATFKGSLARFINHSCDPSCTTRIIAVEGSKKIVIYAERDIVMGEELSYDYKFPLEADESARVPCQCGSDKCRGFIN
eukprot:g6143.t1